MITVRIDEDEAEKVLRKLLQDDLQNIIRDYANGQVIFSHSEKIEARKVRKLTKAYRRVMEHYWVEV